MSKISAEVRARRGVVRIIAREEPGQSRETLKKESQVRYAFTAIHIGNTAV